MVGRTTSLVLAICGLLLMASFTLGLAQGISAGFAGFWGGLPFWIISLLVLACAIYDIYDTCVRNKK